MNKMRGIKGTKNWGVTLDTDTQLLALTERMRKKKQATASPYFLSSLRQLD